MRFVPERTKYNEGMDYPGDGIHWDRTFMESWLRAGPDQRNWTHRNQTPAVGIIETAADEWSLYAASHYGWASNRLQRLAVRPHGFAALRAGYRGGECISKPLTLNGNTLRLNYATSAVGSIGVEAQECDGTPIKGFALADSQPLFGDELDAVWPADFSTLRGQTIRLRFVLQDADLYSLRAT